MYVMGYFKKQNLFTREYSDEQYLELQIWQLENIFQNETYAIKNKNLDYIALSNMYITEFELQDYLSVEVDKVICDMSKVFTEEIKNQELQVINNQKIQDSAFIFKKANSKSACYYLIRKRPIINPSTNSTVGLMIAVIKHDVGLFRNIYVKHLLGFSKPDMILQNVPLTEQQRQLLLFLLFGIHSRKEIAKLASKFTGVEVNEIWIKNMLSALYEKFDCYNSKQLIVSIMQNKIKLEIPAGLLKEGSYTL